MPHSATPAEDVWHAAGYAAVRRAAEAFLVVASSLDGSLAQATVPGQEWTGRDVLAHVVSVCRRYLISRERASSAEDLARLNAEELRDVSGSIADLCAEVRDLVDRMAALPGQLPAGMPLRFHAGAALPLAGGWGNLVGEFLAHGHDLHALGAPRPGCSGADLEPLWRCTLSALGPWLTPVGRQAHERWILELGFSSGPVVLNLAGGRVSVDSRGTGSERIVAGDAVDVTLAAIYHRRPSRPVPVAAHELASRIRNF